MDDELLEMLETVLCNEDGSPFKLLRFLDRLLAKQGNMFVESSAELEELEKVAHRVLLLHPRQGWSGEKQLRFLVDLLAAKKYVNAIEPGILKDFRKFQEIEDVDAMLAEQAETKRLTGELQKELEKATRERNQLRRDLENIKQDIASREANQKVRIGELQKELEQVIQERNQLRCDLENAKQETALRQASQKSLIEMDQKLTNAVHELEKTVQERDQARRELETLKKSDEQSKAPIWNPVIPSPVIPKPAAPKERTVSEFAPDPKAFVIKFADELPPCNAGSVRVEKLERTQRYQFSDLYELRRVDFAQSVKEIVRGTFYECSPVELIIRNKDCRILSNQQGAFCGTEVLRIVAPAGGAVEAYAKRENIPFVPLV